jgi:hypothetical protein
VTVRNLPQQRDGELPMCAPCGRGHLGGPTGGRQRGGEPAGRRPADRGEKVMLTRRQLLQLGAFGGAGLVVGSRAEFAAAGPVLVAERRN